MKYSTFILLMFVINGIHAQRVVPIGTGVIGGGGVGAGVIALAIYQDELVIGGLFPEFNGNQRRNLQAWNGSTFNNMAGAFEATQMRVRAMLVHDGELIVAGLEADHGNIARWNGDVWQAMGDGLPNEIFALTIHQGMVHAAGMFGVRRWNGSAWEGLGGSFNHRVNALAEHDGMLYAGGFFTLIEGSPIPHIARWDGVQWSSVADGLNDHVRGLLSTPEGLYIGGDFTASMNGTPLASKYTRYVGAAFENVIDIGNDRVHGFDLVNGSVLVRGVNGSFLLQSATAVAIPFTNATSLVAYNGDLYIAGGNSWAFAGPVTGIGKVQLDQNHVVELDINDMRATVTSTPGLFSKWWIGRSGFWLPGGSSTIYSASPVLRGTHAGMDHYSSMVPHYVNWDYPIPHAGPRAATMDEAFYERYHQVWKVDRAQILAHQQFWDEPWYEMPQMIRDWPAHGDPGNGEPAQLAPFADLNGNGIYEPEQGQYPSIKGDQATWHITHSDPQFFNGQELLPVDLQYMCYGFASDDPALAQTIFVNIKAINRGALAFDDVRIGMFADMDIGFPDDDLAGCDSTRNLFFTYNGQDHDPICTTCDSGWGDDPPAQGIKFLNASMSAHRVFYSEGAQLPLDDHFNGTQNGAPFMELGYPTHFQFPGGTFEDHWPSTLFGRASTGTAGPFSFAPGDTLCVDLAFIFARASGGAYASLELLKLRADSIQAFYDANEIACDGFPLMTNLSAHSKEPENVSLFPNPATNVFTVTASSPIERLEIHDGQGRLVKATQPMQSTADVSTYTMPAGVYLVKVTTTNDLTTIRLILQ